MSGNETMRIGFFDPSKWGLKIGENNPPLNPPTRTNTSSDPGLIARLNALDPKRPDVSGNCTFDILA